VSACALLPGQYVFVTTRLSRAVRADDWLGTKGRNALTSAHDAASIRVQLDGVTFIDAAGRTLLRRMHEEGAALAAAAA
jgi:hypothetical protein